MLSNKNVEAQVKSTKLKLALKTLLSHKVPEISVQQAAATKNEFVFLDAREEEEFAVSHIANAKFIGAKNFRLKSIENIPKDKAIVVYCSIGKRSEDIAVQLSKAGFTNVRNLYGGLFEWVNQDHPIVDKAEKETKKVHAYSRFWGMFLDKGEKVY